MENAVYQLVFDENEPWWASWRALFRKYFGIDAPRDAQEAVQLDNERRAWGTVGEKVIQVGNANSLIFGFIPGYSALQSTLTKDYGAGTLYISLDLFGGAIVKTPFQVGKHFIKVADLNSKVPAIAATLRSQKIYDLKIFQRNTSTKYALIGQTMDRIKNTKSVIDDMFGSKTETFPPSPDAEADWSIRTLNGSITLSPSEIRQTLMWKENVIWINRMMADGYNFIDIGKDYLKERRGIFYDMERTYVYIK